MRFSSEKKALHYSNLNIRLCKSIALVCDLEISDLSDADKTKALTAGAYIPSDIKLIRTFGFGCVMAIDALWEKLGIGKTLRDICKANRLDIAYERVLLAMTANMPPPVKLPPDISI